MYKKSINILVVDDEIADRKLVKMLLARSQQPVEFVVTPAGSLNESFESLENNDFDLVLLDLGLPDSQGLETIERFCQACPHIPVIVLTGLADEKTGVEAIKRGASDYLVKKKSFEDILIRAIRYSLERKQAYKKRDELLKRLETVNEELRNFTYMASHDLKTPLLGIAMLANWISTDCADKFDDNNKERMDLLINRIDQTNNLIDGVLEYSRIERVEEAMVPINLNDLVARVIDMIKLPETITITANNELPEIQCKETHLSQLFQNLLSNAVQHIDKPNGRIEIGCDKENDFWKFAVSDNGPGIEEEHFERIFQIFQTLSPRDKADSTGVGLAIAKKIVELYGGRIWVESNIGKGSTFFFTLPKYKTEVNHEKLETHIAY